MIDQTEELLRAGMERFTAGTNVPAGLAVKAARHRQRNRRTRIAAAIGVASAAAITAAVVAVPGPAPRVQTAASVVSRVQGALSQASSQHAIQHVRETTTLRIYLAGTDISGQTAESWSYRGQSRNEVYAPDGQIAAVLGRVPRGKGPQGTAGDRHAGQLPGKDLRALELKPVKAGPLTAGFWVDPATYLPVRDLVTAGRATIRDDFTWLPPTPANLTALDVRVPPGSTQVLPQD